MYQELISYSFDATEWAEDGKYADFTQLAYPALLSEISYGDLALTDEQDHAKCLHLSEVELPFLAIHLKHQIARLQNTEVVEAFITSIHQHFELVLRLEGTTCIIGFVEEPEKNIAISLENLQMQVRNFSQSLWVDMCHHFPLITEVRNFEKMEQDFMK
jgi:hypothetical protein